MVLKKNFYHKRAWFVGSFLGLIQLCYMILSGIFAYWAKDSDPIAHGIFFDILLPFSIFLFVMSILAGYSYLNRCSYHRAAEKDKLIPEFCTKISSTNSSRLIFHN